jgi:hypothetical protein
MGVWRISVGNSIAPGATIRHGYWWAHTNPYTGQTEGNWKGPVLGLATPEQLSTQSSQVTTANSGFVDMDQGIVYTTDVHCEGPDVYGSYELWVENLIP